MDELKIKRLLELRDLKERGVLTAEEVEAEKSKILAEPDSDQADTPPADSDVQLRAANRQREDSEGLDDFSPTRNKMWWLVAFIGVIVSVIFAVLPFDVIDALREKLGLTREEPFGTGGYQYGQWSKAAALGNKINPDEASDEVAVVDGFTDEYVSDTAESHFEKLLADANWISTGRGFSVPSFMKKTKDDDFEWGDLVYSFGPVDICYSAITYRGAYGDFPVIGDDLANGTQIKNITYSAPKHSIYSGYLNDGRVYYMKVGVEDMLEESHEIGDDIYIGGLYAMPYLSAVYPKSYEKACEIIIKMVMKWNG